MDGREIAGYLIGSGILAVLLTFLIQWVINKGRVKFSGYHVVLNHRTTSWGLQLFNYFTFELQFENSSKNKLYVKVDTDNMIFFDGQNHYQLFLSQVGLSPAINLEGKEIQSLKFDMFTTRRDIDISVFVVTLNDAFVNIKYSIGGQKYERKIYGNKISLNEQNDVYIN